MQRVLAGLCVGAMAVAAVGCGDDEERLTADEFLEQANAICSAANAEADAEFEEAFPEDGSEPSIDEIVVIFEETFLPSIRGQIEDLRDLNPPEELSDEVEELLDDAEAALDDVEQLVEDDPESVFFEDEDPFADVNAQAEAIGLTACAE